MKTIDILAAVLLVIGGLNWGLVGLMKFDLVQSLLGGVPALMNTVYILVGAAGLYQAISWKRIQLRWSQPMMQTVRS
jgi:uncharacterized membrane protein YuzA (DUF378 family)